MSENGHNHPALLKGHGYDFDQIVPLLKTFECQS